MALTMKTQIIHIVGSMDCGGIQEVIINLVTNVDRSLMEPIVLYYAPGPNIERLNRLGVKHYLIAGTTSIGRAYHTWRQIRRFPKALVQTHYTMLAVFIAKVAGHKVLETVHNTYWWFGKSILKRMAYSSILQIADRVSCVSEYVYKYTNDTFWFKHSKALAIRNTVPDDRTKATSTRSEARKRLKIPEGTVTLGALSTISEQKRLLEIINTFKKVNEKYPETCLIIPGDLSKNKEYADKLKAAANELNVIFTGRVNEIADLLMAYDIFISASEFEGGQLNLVEAMAAGLAIVSTKVGMADEVLGETKAGLLVPRDDLSLLFEEICHVVGSETLRRDLGETAKHVHSTKLNNESMISRYEAVYQELMQTPCAAKTNEPPVLNLKGH